ncbi:MAG: biopolymer transporter ExbD [Imperialibacter sp.]|uniref:ExbD/TolR family protein n=1 Tax=Imperialibacter sp. TaxID=2038411 RepID=UPI0032F051C5
MNAFRRKTILNAEISTASLPDIVFLLLFFFMVTAVIRTDEKLVKYEVPKAKHINKAEMKTLIRELQVGLPANARLGTEPLISDGSHYLKVSELVQWVNQEKATLPEAYKDQIIIVLKADEAVKMGLIADIQQELRKSNARKVLYRSKENI